MKQHDTKKKKLTFGKKKQKNELNELNEFKRSIEKQGNAEKLITNPQQLQHYVAGSQIPITSLNYYKNLYLTNFKRHQVLLIRMILRNKKTAEFFIANDRPMFSFQSGLYCIDSSLVFDDISSGYPCLLYHQDFSLPINILVSVSELEDTVSDDVRLTANPEVLSKLVESHTIQSVMAGGMLDKQLKFITIFIVICLILMFVNTIALMINFIA